jgi:hypothetical protein
MLPTAFTLETSTLENSSSHQQQQSLQAQQQHSLQFQQQPFKQAGTELYWIHVESLQATKSLQLLNAGFAAGASTQAGWRVWVF